MGQEIETIRFDRPDGSLTVDVAGDGPLVICLHGWTFDRRMWRPQIDVLSENYRMVMPDRRGFGRSSASPDLDREVEDIIALADRMGADRFFLIGMSQGGRVALRIADRYPGRVRGLVLMSAPLDGFPPPPEDEEIPVPLYRQMVAEGRLEAMKAHWSAHPMCRAEGEAVGLIAMMLADYEGRDLIAGPSGTAAPALIGRLADIQVPTLVITGGQDTNWRQRMGAALAEGLANARHLLIPEAGHMACMTHPEQVNEAILEHLVAL